MKNHLLGCIVFIVSIAVSLAQESTGYRITGRITGLDDDVKVYLSRGTKRIDSASVKDGEFILAGSLIEPAFMYLYTGKGRESKKLADILLDNRELMVTGTKPDYDHVRVSGSDIDEQWRDWYDHDQHLGYQRHRLNQVYQSLLGKKDTASANVLKQLGNELMADRINMLKSYVKRYHNSASGAVLPTLCTLQDRLSRSDYMEMYEVLTPEMQNTEMGREIIKQANKAKSTR
ncbi:MAG: DUF4369 domain-containing protein [Cytophagaceae bacterium]|nr:DUF4369 domain-containing protein [Cytophagaceae bacterium]